MRMQACDLPGLLLIEPQVFADSRGYFLELWNSASYQACGLDGIFVQDNLSCSCKGTLRGLHFQNPSAQGKLVTVLDGAVFDVAVDIRRSSATFGRWHGMQLSSGNQRQLYIPPGFAHGFQVLSDSALFYYKCTAHYHRAHEVAIRWNDPSVGVAWPLPDPILSERDASAPLLSELPPDVLFA